MTMTMKTTVFTFRQSQSSEEISDLQAHLAQLDGEPFCFLRVSYGDELTLHFGRLHSGISPKTKHRQFGDYVLGVRASRWLLKSDEFLVAPADVLAHSTILPSAFRNITKEELESGTFIGAGSRVLSVTAFVVKQLKAIGLQMVFSDGTALVVLPSERGPDDQEKSGTPELADWDLLTPSGQVSAYPGPRWGFEKKEEKRSVPAK